MPQDSLYSDSPNMSDSALLISVEDLINRALGSPEENTVNFKLVQMILHILARQQRMLEQRVEIRSSDLKSLRLKSTPETTTESSSSKSPRSPAKRRMAGIKEERSTKQDKKEKEGHKDLEKIEKKEQKEVVQDVEKDKDATEKQTKQGKAKAEKEKRRKEKELEKEKPKAEKEMEQAAVTIFLIFYFFVMYFIIFFYQKEAKKARVMSGTIAITEAERGKEKVLVVEKGPSTQTETRGRANIDVVTQSQFALLEAAVRDLTEIAVPKPLELPDNEKLKSDLASGNATLPEAMQAMQVTARVQAAENAINRMTGLLTQLAAAGALPDDIAEKVDEVKIEPSSDETDVAKPEKAKSHLSVVSRKSVAIDPKSSQASRADGKSPKAHSAPTTPRPSTATSRQSVATRPSALSMGPAITHEELNTALRALREELSKNLDSLTMRATTAAENALHTAMSVADKVDVALKLNNRVTVLYSLVGDYSDQLSGFDSGLTTQMRSFQDQIVQINTDLKNGLAQLENVNNNAENAALIELTERYQELVTELEATQHAHKNLTTLHSQLGGEMHSLVECVEMLREQKSDRDEVLDGLRDKADITRLAGLLSEEEFAKARADFERRIELCHDKFHKQEVTWMTAIKDLTRITDGKGQIVDLLSARDEAQKELQLLENKIRVLATVLGEPKAALLTRQLARGALCGACGAAASMQARDAVAGLPPRLPPLPAPPAPPAPAEAPAPPEPCRADLEDHEPQRDRHMCHRWCGGSHTLVTEATTRERASPVSLETAPTKKYTGYGSDGRLYMLEEELRPCIECNAFGEDRGAGDAAPGTE
ncbi:girdin-like [Vanessa cardui]|uniref:girdin-like n=1 Tax=Vanessa cardui TaxID=171605 RepID=UPI001F13EDF9|nr:girdin-like [Vanessa cardui]